VSGPAHVACLCAAWCRLCDDYRPVFDGELAALAAQDAAVAGHWIDIEEEAELLGELDIETFPTLVVVDARGVRFAGALTPQPQVLQRLLRSTVLEPGAAPVDTDAVLQAFATRLRARSPDR
jgi:thioredoxin 1